MEANAKSLKVDSAPPLVEFNFEKLMYKIPSSFERAPLSNRSVKKKEKDEKKGGKKDKKDKERENTASASISSLRLSANNKSKSSIASKPAAEDLNK